MRVSSTKYISYNNSNNEPLRLTCVLYGGLNYDCDVDMINTIEKNNSIIDSLSLERGRFDFLPGTKKEVDSIETIILKSNRIVFQKII